MMADRQEGSPCQVLAFDFGASSGRLMLGRLDGCRLSLEEIHRFSNDPVMLGDTLYWDVLRLVYEIKTGLIKAKAGAPAQSLGIDTWGVDFGLLDGAGRLLENPVHYRDQRTDGILDQAFAIMPREELYQRTGIQFMPINTLFQLLALRKRRPDLLERAAAMLLMPDLLMYFLTGRKQSEYTIASTGQMIDPTRRDWDRSLIDQFGIPTRLLQPLVAPGTPAGSLAPAVCAELGIDPIQAISVASHDTASAVVAVPAVDQDFLYISSGTWSLLGIESPRPLLGETSYRFNFTNEGGYGGTTRFLKNIMGLWLIQESRRQWIREGATVSYADLEREALAEQPFVSLIDPDDPSLAPPGNMPQRIREICRRTGQPVPESRGAVMRCIYESLALKYRMVKEQLEQVSGRVYPTIHVVGGGTKDGLLCRFTADSTGSTVIAGPIEATALGNVTVQLIASGAIADLAAARQIIAASTELRRFPPADRRPWDLAAERYVRLFGR